MGQSQKLNIQPRSRSPLVQLTEIRKSFDGKTVISGLNLTINNGEFLTLLGPLAAVKQPFFVLSPDWKPSIAAESISKIKISPISRRKTAT